MKKLKTKPPHTVIDKIHIKPVQAHIHVHRYHVKGHYNKLRDGTKKWIPAHWAIHHVESYDVKGKEITRKEVRFGGHSKELYQHIFDGYMKKWQEGTWMKGKSKTEAEAEAKKWAGGVVGKIYRNKLEMNK